MSFEEGRPCCLGIACNHFVEFSTTNDVPVTWVDGVSGPLQFEFFAMRGSAQALITMECRKAYTEPHVVELFHCARRKTIAASLFTRKVFLLHDRHRAPVFGQPVASRRPSRASSDHQDISIDRTFGHRCQRMETSRSTRDGEGNYSPDEARGLVPTCTGAGMRAAKSSAMVSKLLVPASRARKIGDSGEHQFSYSAAHASSAGSVPVIS